MLLTLAQTFSHLTVKVTTAQHHLFPVGGDDSDVFGKQLGKTLFSLCLFQPVEIRDQRLNLGHIEERRTVGLSLVFPQHSVEDHRKTLL